VLCECVEKLVALVYLRKNFNTIARDGRSFTVDRSTSCTSEIINWALWRRVAHCSVMTIIRQHERIVCIWTVGKALQLLIADNFLTKVQSV